MKRQCAFALMAIIVLFAPRPARADHPGAGFGQTISGPIVTVPAGTLPAHRWAASVRLEWVSFETFSDAELLAFAADGNEVHSVDDLVAPSFGLSYGITERFTLGARIPYVTRRDIREGHLELGVPEVHDHGDSRGAGDLSLLAQYRATHGNGPRQFAILLGLKLPTGETGVTGSDGTTFEIEHQPGSGSVDPVLGAAWSLTFPGVQIDANVLGTIVSEGDQQTNLGNLLNLNAAASWQLSSTNEGRHGTRARLQDHGHMDLVMEVNGEWRSRTEIDNVEQENTGGGLAYITPGFRYSAPSQWSLSASVGIPFFQDLNGTQHETRLRAIAALGVLF